MPGYWIHTLAVLKELCPTIADGQEMMRFALDSVFETRWDMSKDVQSFCFVGQIWPLISRCCSPKFGQQRPAGFVCMIFRC